MTPFQTTILLLTASPLTAQTRPTNIDRGEYTTCPNVQTLHCKNGSTCLQGIASFDARHDHLNLQTHESGYYCQCLPGYIGHECQVQIDDCEGGTGYNPSDPTGVLASCYHGSHCRENGEGFYCDCEVLNDGSGATAAKFAGLMCQHESTSFCAASLVGSGGGGHGTPGNKFCTNHGKCVKMVVDDRPHPGCECRKGWAGDHCEILAETVIVSRVQNGAEGGGSPWVGEVLFSVLMIAIGLVVTGIAVLLRNAWKNRNGGETNTTAPKKAVLGSGDLEADGSGTLGNGSKDGGDVADNGHSADADGDMELTLKEEAGEMSHAVDSEDGPAEKPEIV